MLFRALFTGASDDFQARIQATRRKHHINIGGIGTGGGHHAQRVFNTCFAQGLLAGRVSDMHQPFRVHLGSYLFVMLNDHKRAGIACQFMRHTHAHASGAADNVMIFQAGHFTLHTSPSENLDQLEF